MGVTEAIQVALADYGVRYGKDTTAETWGTEARAKVASAAKALKVSDERLCQAFVRAAEAPGANPTWPPRPNAVLQVLRGEGRTQLGASPPAGCERCKGHPGLVGLCVRRPDGSYGPTWATKCACSGGLNDPTDCALPAKAIPGSVVVRASLATVEVSASAEQRSDETAERIGRRAFEAAIGDENPAKEGRRERVQGRAA